MARKKRDSGGGGPGSGDWLNTYADMVTLLLTFFILLFSMSSLDATKFNQMVAAFASDTGSANKLVIYLEDNGDQEPNASNIPLEQEGAPPEMESLEEIFQYLQSKIEEENLSGSVEVAQGEGYVFIRFMEDMLFEPNRSVLKQEDRSILEFVGRSIKSVQNSANSINIVGHTAAIPNNPDYAVSDRMLSTERANTVLMYFEDEIGINGEKLFATGYGKWKPIAPNTTAEGQGQNRRVEILISKENNSLSEQLDNVYEKLVE